jgi:ankyrin repeat protein
MSENTNPLNNVAILSRLLPYIATSVKRTVYLALSINSTWSDCLANYSAHAWENLFRIEKQTAERLAMRSCNLGLFEIARVAAGNPSAAQLRDSNGFSCLHNAAFCGRPGTCSLLLQMKETDVNALTNNEWTPLRCSLYNNDVNAIKILLQDERTDVARPCKEGETPLMAAIFAANNRAMVQTLLESEPFNRDPDTKKKLVNWQSPLLNDFSALFVAVRNREAEIAKMLLQHGADIEAKENKLGRTPLLFIAAAPEVVAKPMVQLLLEHGASLDAKDKNGLGVLEIVDQRKNSNTGSVKEMILEEIEKRKKEKK